jgi:hypothetical protein
MSLERGGYRVRIRQNVMDSNATVILAPGDLRGGTLPTRYVVVQEEYDELLSVELQGGSRQRQDARG